MSRFRFGPRSLVQLATVHPHLQRVCRRALELSLVDFSVHEGRRTRERQRQLVARGASQTLDSRHLTGLAVDLVPWVGGASCWKQGPCCEVAVAMFDAAAQLEVDLRWGGNWSMLYPPLTADVLQDAIADYCRGRRESGKSAFVDAVHFELVLP